jgi:hypothetical protein
MLSFKDQPKLRAVQGSMLLVELGRNQETTPVLTGILIWLIGSIKVMETSVQKTLNILLK